SVKGAVHIMVFKVFTVAPENYEPIKERIAERFPGNYYEVGDGQWLVADAGTAKEIYIRLFPEAEFPLAAKNVAVFGITGYWGFAPQDMWEWIRSKTGAKLG
ncbi:MAG TPA: hypothetical protein DHU55_18145, partial [Blastocatellia bacterium]|nr:hypothetical protein [Blastocatellia bacterium]